MRRGSARHQPKCFTPARPIANIFILTGNFGGRGWGRGRAGRSRRTQEPKLRWRWGWRSRGENQGRGMGNVQRGRSVKEEDGSDTDDGSMGLQETRLDRGITGNQQHIRGGYCVDGTNREDSADKSV